MSNLYKRFGGLHNTRQGQNLHPFRTRPLEGAGTGFGRGSGRQDVIDQQDVPARDLGRVRHPKSTQDIAPAAAGGCHRALAWGGPASFQRPDRHRFGGPATERARQFRRLIVTSLPKSDAMKRHGHDQIGLVQEGFSSALQPMRESRHQFQSVRMLECQNGRAAVVVIGKDRASTVIRWPPGQAGGAKCCLPRIEREGQPAAIAHRAVQERDPAPTIGTKPVTIAQRLAARDAERRKQHIRQRGFQFCPHPL